MESEGWTRKAVEKELLRILDTRVASTLFFPCAVIILYVLFRRLLSDRLIDELIFLIGILLLLGVPGGISRKRKYLALAKAGEFDMYTDVCIGKRSKTVAEIDDIKNKYYLIFRHAQYTWEIGVNKTWYECFSEGDEVHSVYFKGCAAPHLVYDLHNRRLR